MASLKRGIKYLISNRIQFIDSIVKNYLGFLPDKLYLSLRYRCQMGRWINWNNPQTFTEKLQWLKVYDRRPEYTTMVDKVAVKKYVSDLIGEEYVIPTLGVWDNPEDIDWDTLPNQFVLKTTHGGGGNGVIICRDKRAFDTGEAVLKLNESLKSDIYSTFREWPYKDVSRRIIAEKFIAPMKSHRPMDLPDYKFFCFNGKVRFFKVDFGRFVEHHANYYTPDGQLLDLGEVAIPPIPDLKIELPHNIEKMILIAERLSSAHRFLRVDLYNSEGKIYFGELTFYPASGMGKFSSFEWDEKLGKALTL